VIKKIGAAGAAMILTVRSVDEGGEKRISDGEKLNIFRDNISLVDAIDIELRSPIIAEVMKVTKKNKKKTIVSWHDLKFTPSDKKLTGILYRAKKTGADLIKIAARANSMEDLNRLMKFTVKNRSKNIVIISLGSLGSISRVIFPRLGSLITYSYVSRPSGSGQIPLKELRKYLRMSCSTKNIKPPH
jgi:3-dehydroquinate dehydratase-1